MNLSKFLTLPWLRPMWRVPAFSGLFIVLALALEKVAPTAWNPQFADTWLLASGGHDLEVSSGFALADLLMLIATAIALWPIATQAVRALRVGFFGIDLLVSVAAIGAVLIGNFWEAAAVTFLFALGHALEAATLNKTRSALEELVAVAPSEATVLTDQGPKTVPVHQVERGQTVLIKAGARVPVDGQVTSGLGAVDESMITGESLPAQKSVGDKVFAGTISSGGLLEVEALGVGADTTLARIVRRVEEAQDAKAPTQALIDRIARWYTPAVMLIALVTGLITRDIVLALTLLVIGCPGALVISIPVAVVAGIGRAARDGILVKGGEFLETSAKIDAVAFDKTGTLTRNRPVLAEATVLAPDLSRTDLLRIAALAESGSDHPLARPVIEAAQEAGVAPTDAPNHVETVAGRGIVAHVDEGRANWGALTPRPDGQVEILVGNAALLREHGIDDLAAAEALADEFAAQGRTPLIVAAGGNVLGVLAAVDEVRPDAADALAQLRSDGVKTLVMLTGDAPQVAQAVAGQVGIDQVNASLMPEDKLDQVRALQDRGFTVAMVGDGINDAPALATADIGVAMGAAGSAVATETADIALMSDDLTKLAQAIRLARRTRRVMIQNIWIAFITVIALLVGVFGGQVTMAIGMFFHEASVMLVIANAMRLSRNPRRR